MLGFLPGFLIGILNIFLMTLNLLFLTIFLTLIGLFKLITFNKAHVLCEKLASLINKQWAKNSDFILKLLIKTQFEIVGLEKIKRHSTSFLMSNHLSWVDIIVLQKVFVHVVPMFKFFVKKEILWVPFIGLDCWIMGFPFMKRYSKEFLEKNPHLAGKDLESTRKACERFKKYPATLINFIEGTRFTPAKHEKQASPYPHLLKPKAGGMAFSLEAMTGSIEQIIDVTLVYPSSSHIAWDFFCGRFKKIIIDLEALPATPDLIGDYPNDPVFRQYFQNWLNERWQQKEAKIAQYKQELTQ